MTQLLASILALILAYGYPMIVGLILLGYIWLPVPQGAILVAAGGLAASGVFNLPLLIAVVVATAVTGDLFGYIVARKLGESLLRRPFFRKKMDGDKLTAIRRFFKKWGFWCVFTSRWLFTPLGIPVDIIAGYSKYSFKKFFVAIVVGEIIWALGYILLGNFFGTNWQSLLVYINNVPTVFGLVAVGAMLLYVGIRMRR